MPERYFPIVRREGGRPISVLNGCKIHTNVCDLVRWDDGEEECMLCARDRQISRLTPEQHANAAFHLPYISEWVK